MEQDHMLARREDRVPVDSKLPLPPPVNPPSYAQHHQSHDPKLVSLPEAPSTELVPILHRDSAAPAHPDAHVHFHPSIDDKTVSEGKPQPQEQLPPVNTLPSFSTLTDSLSPLSPPPESTTSSAAVTSASPPDQKKDLALLRSPPFWPSLNPLTTFYTPSHARSANSPAKMDVEMSGTRAGSVSLDDPDVRMAAEALGDLRADLGLPPSQLHSPSSQLPPPPEGPEPLLQLLTTSHPLLAKTIEGTTSAYNTSKNFSPRFKSSAEYVEGYVEPISNALGSVGRITGVEGGVRWFLRGSSRRQPSSPADLESGDGARNKRRRTGDGSRQSREVGEEGSPALSSVETPKAAEFDPFAYRNKERRTSMSTVDTLPAYDDHRSPAYTAEDTVSEEGERAQFLPREGARIPTNWQSRLVMSTSGLSISMSEESLRSLKYCLDWLRWANDHLARIIASLKSTLEQYERRPQTQGGSASPDAMAVDEDGQASAQTTDARAEAQATPRDYVFLGQRVAALKNDVLKTLRGVIETVSKYAGGALPENARNLVKSHLTSLPQRFRMASQAGEPSASSSGQPTSEKEVREGANRVLLLAQEGLEMMSQVSGVLDGTVVSAEEWLARLGRKTAQRRAALNGSPQVEPLTGVGIEAGDVKMGGDSKTG